MLFGDQTYQDLPLTVRERIVRSAQRAWNEGGRLGFGNQVRAAVATVVTASGLSGSMATLAYQYGKEIVRSYTSVEPTEPMEVEVTSTGDFETPQRKRKSNQLGISPGDKKSKRMARRAIRTEDEDEQGPDVVMEEASEVAVARASGATTGRGSKGHGETPISYIPVSKRKPWAATEQAILTYYTTFNRTITSTDPTQTFQFRLNSIYDCQQDTALSGAEVTLATADAADGTVQEPTYRAYWMQYYNYWTVVKSRYRIRMYIEPSTYSGNQDNVDISTIAYVYHHGRQNPPIYNSTGPNVIVPHYIKREHDGMYYFPINFKPSVAGTSSAENIVSCSGDWMPGSIKHEVFEDELAQTWHKATEVPPTPEFLTVHVQKAPFAGTFGSDVKVYCEVSLEYTAQFKDLKTIFQYPTGQTDVPAGTNVAAQV